MKPLSFLCGLFLIACLVLPSAHGQGIYEVRHEVMNASGWFGGDNRPGSTRSVGVAQSVQIDTPVILNNFAFYFTMRFDFAANPDGFGHEVTLKLTVRDSSGNAIQSYEVVVPASFAGGWVEWPGLSLAVTSPSRIIFTAYLIGAVTTHEYYTGHSSDLSAGYPGGVRYVKEDNNDADMNEWTDWVEHSWDSAFRLSGTILTVGVSEDQRAPASFALGRNYPNPFNPATTLGYSLPELSFVSITIFNFLGGEVRTLLSEMKPAGNYEFTWDGTDNIGRDVSSGTYLCQMVAGNFRQSRKLVFLK